MKFSNYFIINVLLACIIIAIFIYAGFFAFGNGPVTCSFKAYTGQPCETCGLTRGINKIIHLQFTEAAAYSKYAFKIFGFFAISLVLRLIAILFSKNNANFIKVDIIFSILLFLFCFAELILSQF